MIVSFDGHVVRQKWSQLFNLFLSDGEIRTHNFITTWLGRMWAFETLNEFCRNGLDYLISFLSDGEIRTHNFTTNTLPLNHHFNGQKYAAGPSGPKWDSTLVHLVCVLNESNRLCVQVFPFSFCQKTVRPNGYIMYWICGHFATMKICPMA